MNPSFLITLLCLLAVIMVSVYIVNNNRRKTNTNDTTSNTDKPTTYAPAPETSAKPKPTTHKPPTHTSSEDFSDRKGYDADFIRTPTFQIDLNNLLQNHAAALAPLLSPTATNGNLLHYHHFSIATNRERRMPLLTAVNIDGKQAVDLGRDADKWSFDPRLSIDFQTPPEVYSANDLDLGHLVRRLDPVWGDVATAANYDTFHYTVCAPQHKKLNRVTWLSLENYILSNTKNESLKVSVFTGPVFSEADIPYRGTLLPLQFWKMAAIIKHDGTPSVSAYLLSHADDISGMRDRGLIDETGFGEYKTYQIALSRLQELTGLHLDDLLPFDPLHKQQGMRGLDVVHVEVAGAGDIVL